LNWTESTPISVANLNDLENRITTAETNVTNGKSAIANAVNAKGIPASSSDAFSALATKIATPSLVNTADANAVAGDILSGKSGYVNGVKVTGIIPDQSVSEPLADKYLYYDTGTEKRLYMKPPKGYFPGQPTGGWVTGGATYAVDNNLIPVNILSGKSIFGVAGTLVIGKKWASGNGAPSSSAVVNITGLSFKPSLVLILTSTNSSIPNESNFLRITVLFDGTLLTGRYIEFSSGNMVPNPLPVFNSNNGISSNTFKFFGYASQGYSWVAYE
jgi:hypothetical protein